MLTLPAMPTRQGIMALLDAYEDAAREDSRAQTPTTIGAVREARRAVLRYTAAACPELAT